MASLSGYNWDGMGADLWKAAGPFITQLYALAYDEANRTLPIDIAFDITNPRVKDALKVREKLVKGISDTVFEHLKGLVERQSEEGQAPAKLAQAIREYGITDSKSRSLMIARTESAAGYNVGAALAYGDAGIEKVKVLDGDDDEVCAAVNGTTQTLEWAMDNPTGHPNCTRAFVPVVD